MDKYKYGYQRYVNHQRYTERANYWIITMLITLAVSLIFHVAA